jgi:hypothetical protein
MSMKNPSKPTGSRARGLPACSARPHLENYYPEIRLKKCQSTSNWVHPTCQCSADLSKASNARTIRKNIIHIFFEGRIKRLSGSNLTQHPSICLEEVRATTNKEIQHSPFLCPDMNLGSLKHDAGALSTRI